jgi:hypothetical protein
VTRRDDEIVTRDWLLTVALDWKDGRKVGDLAGQLLDESQEDATPATMEQASARLRQALLRLLKEGRVTKIGSARATTWSLSQPPSRGKKRVADSIRDTSGGAVADVSQIVVVHAQNDEPAVADTSREYLRHEPHPRGSSVADTDPPLAGKEILVNGGRPSFPDEFAAKQRAAWDVLRKGTP